MMKESIQMGVVSYLISQLLVLLLIKRPQTSKDSESLTVTCREILILPLHVSLIHSSSPFSPKLSGKKKKYFCFTDAQSSSHVFPSFFLKADSAFPCRQTEPGVSTVLAQWSLITALNGFGSGRSKFSEKLKEEALY